MLAPAIDCPTSASQATRTASAVIVGLGDAVGSTVNVADMVAVGAVVAVAVDIGVGTLVDAAVGLSAGVGDAS